MKTKIPSLHHLEAFIAVADCGNQTTAAPALCITPEAVHHRIANLEEFVGHQLFDRVKGFSPGRTMELNKEGRLFYTKAKKTVQIWV